MELSKKAYLKFKNIIYKDDDSIKSKIIFDFSLLYILTAAFIFALVLVYHYFFMKSSTSFIYFVIGKQLIYLSLFMIILRIILSRIIDSHLINRFSIYKEEMFNMLNKNTATRLTLFGSDEMDKLAFYTNNIFDKYDDLLNLEKKNSLIDPLTLCFNRRALNLNFESEREKSQRKNHHISLAMFDIDNFKKVNDTYGHDIGDEVLKHLSNIIKIVVRKYDTVYRVGGEEFLVLLPDMKKRDVNKFLSRLQKEITYKLKKLVQIVEQPITVSGGLVSSKNYDINSVTLLDDMIKESDELLYKAKQNGKNKILFNK